MAAKNDPPFNAAKLRNIGIIAHIDAGKTTTTERVLYYTDSIHTPGDVDEGTTTTDSDKREQDKGITIFSAAVTCYWKPKDTRINIIDTPGHVDFTAEVERSLRVLDGGLVIFSGVEGVEAQSETVWHQADHYKVPRICFINKLDRIGADFERVLQEIADELHGKPVAIQYPIGLEKDFTAVIDLIEMKSLHFNAQTQGKDVTVEEIPADYMEKAQLWRGMMIERLADLDDDLAMAYLEETEITSDQIKAVLRKGTLTGQIQPVMCGSSLKYIGVQPLLNAVADFLPSPLDLPPVVGKHPTSEKEIIRKPSDDEPFTGLLFKIQANEHDELGFVRIYAGTLKASTRVLNAGRNKKENITRLWHIEADHRAKIELGQAGDIVGVVGLKNSKTGDTLTDQKNPLLLQDIIFPQTVISVSIEPDSSADRKKLVDVLAMLEKEDPTFTARVSEETGEMLISGMGELHLEIIVDRIANDFKVPVRTGKPRVSYRETLKKPIETEAECHQVLASGPIFAKVKIALEPFEATGEREPTFKYSSKLPPETIPAEFLPIISEQLHDECLAGGLSGYPLTGIKATLLGAEYREGESNEQAYRIAVAQAVRKALSEAGVNILEPVMKLEVVTPEEFLGDVTADLGMRRSAIEEMGQRGELRTITARVPLEQMFGYTTALRSLSRGKASASMEPLDYTIAPQEVANRLL